MMRSLACFLWCAILACPTALAGGQTSTNYAIPRDSINAGVGDMVSTSFRLSSSVGGTIGGEITSVSFVLASGFRMNVPVAPGTLTLLSVVSRKFHGAVPFKLDINLGQPITGNITIEPRGFGTGHTLVFHFDSAITSVTAATAVDAFSMPAGSATVATVGGDVEVSLSNVADGTRITITLTGLNGNGTALASMGFLVGDVTSSRAVNSGDISALKAKGTLTSIDNTNFKFDLNGDGKITSQDVSVAKSRSGRMIP
jgi:hypothetical protein